MGWFVLALILILVFKPLRDRRGTLIPALTGAAIGYLLALWVIAESRVPAPPFLTLVMMACGAWLSVEAMRMLIDQFKR